VTGLWSPAIDLRHSIVELGMVHTLVVNRDREVSANTGGPSEVGTQPPFVDPVNDVPDTTTALPEPGAAALIGAGLLMTLLLLRYHSRLKRPNAGWPDESNSETEDRRAADPREARP